MHLHDASCFVHTFPISRSVRWYAYHACLCQSLALYANTLAHMSMHESCLLVCCSCFNIMKLWTFDPNLHLSFTNSPFCLLSCLFAFSLVCLHSYFFAYHVYHVYLLYASFICSLHLFPFIACLLVPCLCLCLCLCMYTHGARMLGDKAQSPRRKQKGRKREHVEISQVAIFSRFRSLAFPFGYVLF